MRVDACPMRSSIAAGSAAMRRNTERCSLSGGSPGCVGMRAACSADVLSRYLARTSHRYVARLLPAHSCSAGVLPAFWHIRSAASDAASGRVLAARPVRRGAPGISEQTSTQYDPWNSPWNTQLALTDLVKHVMEPASVALPHIPGYIHPTSALWCLPGPWNGLPGHLFHDAVVIPRFTLFHGGSER